MNSKTYRVYYFFSWDERIYGGTRRRWSWHYTHTKAKSKSDAKRRIKHGNRIVIFAKEVAEG